MNENKTLSLVIFIAILLLYVSGLVYVMIAYVAPIASGGRRRRPREMRQADEPDNFYQPIASAPPAPIQPPIVRQPVGQCAPVADYNSSQQTDFFNESVRYAEQYLYSGQRLDGYKYGGEIDLSRLSDKSKKDIQLSLTAMTQNSVSSREMEQKMRTTAETENVALWFVILHESSKKVLPFQ